MPLKFKDPFETYYQEDSSFESFDLQEKIRKNVISLRDNLLDTDSRYILLSEGRGSGKSHFMGQYLVYKSLDNSYKGKVFLCTREYQNSLSESVYSLVQDIIFDLDLQENYKFTKEYILCKPTGVKFIFRGMQKVVSLKSLKNIAIIAIEEAETVTSKHMEYVIPLLRGIDPSLAKVIIALNPFKPVDDVVSFCDRQKNVVRQSYNIFDLPIECQDPILLEQAEADKIDPDLYDWKWLGKPSPDMDLQPFKNIIEIPETPNLETKGVAYIDPSFMGGDYTALSIVNMYEDNIIVHGYLFRQPHDVCTPQMAKIIKNFPTKLDVYYEANSIGNSPRKNFGEYDVLIKPIKNTENKAKRINEVAGSRYIQEKLRFVNKRDNLLYNKEIKNYNVDACLKNKQGYSDDAPDSLAGALRLLRKPGILVMDL